MKSKNAFIANVHKSVRMRLISQFHSRGFNIYADDMNEPLESSFLRSFQIDCAIIGDPTSMPGGVCLLKIFQEAERPVPTVILFEDRESMNDFDISKFPAVLPLSQSASWEDIMSAILNYTVGISGVHKARRHDRIPVQLAAVCEVAPNRPVIQCQLTNVSTSGAFITANGFLPKIGEIVEVEVKLDSRGDEKLVVSGYVRWVQGKENENDSGFGLEFGYSNVQNNDFLKTLRVGAI